MRHPNLVRIQGAGATTPASPMPQVPFIVMELLAGRTLHEEISLVKRLEVPAALALFAQVLDSSRRCIEPEPGPRLAHRVLDGPEVS